jgi:hypothetical protein
MSTSDNVTRFQQLFAIQIQSAPDEMERRLLAPILQKSVERKSERIEQQRAEIEAVVVSTPNSNDAATQALQNLRVMRNELGRNEELLREMTQLLSAFDFDVNGWQVAMLPEPADAVATVS